MTKRKKNTRERRALVGALCTAAVIVAGSTFAWFTSSDEVTNRLTASADYGVSIVETFTPPANWVPGQKINKDVYATNTGNIAAFVKEDISGVLTYTYESLTGSPDATNGVKLDETTLVDIDGATTMEGGAFLAWTNATGVELGAKVSARQAESDNDGYKSENRWTPTVAGVYIFRRSIDTLSGSTVAYTYSGYYYDGTNYYKIAIGDDVNPVKDSSTPPNYNFDVSSKTLGGNAVIGEDGRVTEGTPNFQYVVEKEVAPAAVTLTYDANGSNPRFVVTAKTGGAGTTDVTTGEGDDTVTNTYDASAMAARAEIDYLNSLALSDAATNKYKQAMADYAYALALATAQNDLADAALIRYNADANKTSKTTAQTTAQTNAIDGASTIKSSNSDYTALVSGNAISPDTLLTSAVVSKINATETDGGTDYKLPNAHQNYVDMTRYWNLMYNTTDGYAKKITDALTAMSTAGVTTEAYSTQLGILVENLKLMETTLDAYKDCYSNIAALDSTATGLTTDNADTVKSKIAGVVTNATDLKNNVTSTTTGSLTDLAAKYTQATKDVTDASTADTTAGDAWKKAVDDYNIAVGAAQSTYTTDTASPLTNNAGKIVPKYSANSTANGTEPRIDVSSTYPDYNTYITGDTTKTADKIAPPTEATYKTDASDESIGTLRTAFETTTGNTTNYQNAYANAVRTVNTAGEITIYVNLNPSYATYWTFDQSTDKTEKASFYLNTILNAGVTSDKLIDSVELADTVTAGAYKDLTFDLNVGLKSAQISYADDQVTITSAAVDSDTDFNLKPTIGTTTNGVTSLTWAAKS